MSYSKEIKTLFYNKLPYPYDDLHYLNQEKDLLDYLGYQEGQSITKKEIESKWPIIMMEVEGNLKSGLQWAFRKYLIKEELEKIEKSQRFKWLEVMFLIATSLALSGIAAKMGAMIAHNITKRMSQNDIRIWINKIKIEKYSDPGLTFRDIVNKDIVDTLSPYIKPIETIINKRISHELSKKTPKHIIQKSQIITFLKKYENREVESLRRIKHKIDTQYKKNMIDGIDIWFWFMKYNPLTSDTSYYEKHIGGMIKKYKDQVLSMGFERGGYSASTYEVSNIYFLGHFKKELCLLYFSFGQSSWSHRHRYHKKKVDASLIVNEYAKKKGVEVVRKITDDMRNVAVERHKSIFGGTVNMNLSPFILDPNKDYPFAKERFSYVAQKHDEIINKLNKK